MSDKDFSRISVVGLGYIGLPTAAMFASRKIEVVGVDVNSETVEIINEGRIHIVEPDLDMVVHAAVQEGYLRATTTVEAAQAFLIAVPTPFSGENHDPDLSYVEAASRAIAKVLEPGNLVVLESTSPIGATEAMAQWLAEARPDLTFPQQAGDKSDIRIAHCPERVLPGKVMRELITNDRVIGGMTPTCSAQALLLYKNFVAGECVIASGPRVAELAKLTENSFRDVNIAFANELSMVCDRLGINVWELIELANRHPRVQVLQPGPGVGGHCIAVDPWFIVSSAPDESKLIRTARIVNDYKPNWVLEKFDQMLADLLQAQPDLTAREVTVACYGIAFKPNIDDLRESPALNIVSDLAKRFPGKLLVVEPNLEDRDRPVIGNAEFSNLASARENADIHLMLVDHNEFYATEPPSGRILDTRGVWA